MTHKIRKTNPILLSLIQNLKKNSYEHDAPIWKDIALRLEKPSKNWPQINLERINKNINENETALIPGKVLSSGSLSKKITIAAWSYSKKAEEKIRTAGCKSMTIEELIQSNPKGKKVRILG
jgi:large subunit ribosomal protein L18e